MTFFQKDNPHRVYFFTWWLCIITLPLPIVVSNASIILLVLAWVWQGGFAAKWKNLLASKWVIPFVLLYLLHAFALFYSSDRPNGFFALEKKATLLLLPLLAASGPLLNERFVQFLKRSFIYSCFILTLLCLMAASIHFLNELVPENFDASTLNSFNQLHPQLSPLWMHFSYIQLGEWAEIHPAYFSMYLALCLVLLLTEKSKTPSQQTVNFFIGFILIAFIAFMSSRMAIIALFVTFFYIIFDTLLKGRPKGISIAVASIVLLSCFVWLNPISRFRVIEEPLNTSILINKQTTEWNSFNYRLLEWKAAWSIISKHALAGVGTGGSDLSMKDFYAHFNKSTIGVNYNPHNQYLQTWIELGLPGLVLLTTCLLIGFWQGQKQREYVAFIIIFSLMCFTESILERQKGIVFFTLFQSLYLSFERPLK
jgi:O-antigen ligase